MKYPISKTDLLFIVFLVIIMLVAIFRMLGCAGEGSEGLGDWGGFFLCYQGIL